MPELKYILVDTLPQPEQSYLEENLRAEAIKTIYVHELPGGFPEQFSMFPAEECIFIAQNRDNLDCAIAGGMATLCYLSSEKSESYLGADMYAEGMEEIDLHFLRRVYQRHHNLPWTILETERCIVREFSMDDLDDLFELYAGEGMTDYMEPLRPYEQEREYQQAYIDNMYRFYGYGMWLVCDKVTGKLIGRAGIEHTACQGEWSEKLQLGYAIGVSYQRRGYATEVCQAMVDYARTEMEIPSLCCLIEEKNEKSIGLARKLGFLFHEMVEIKGKKMCLFQREFTR